MMKLAILLCGLAVVAATPFGNHTYVAHPRNYVSEPAYMEPKLSLCNACIQLSVESLNILLNEILNAGVVGGCSKLCSNLKSKDAALACDIICDVVGIKVFVKAINNTDLDPFYFCELLHLCPAGSDDASASINSVLATPSSGPVDTKFALVLNFTVTNATGVGEIGIAVQGGEIDIAQGFPNTGYQPGAYALEVDLTAQDDPSADPPVIWSPGTYTFTFELCQGECGSKHPHSKVFGRQSGHFTISD